MTGSVVLLRPFLFQQCLGLTVATLLLPVRAYRVAAVVPDNRRGAEPQRPTALPQPPADIDVVTGNPEARIERANLFEVRFTKSHVATRDVLSLSIRE